MRLRNLKQPGAHENGASEPNSHALEWRTSLFTFWRPCPDRYNCVLRNITSYGPNKMASSGTAPCIKQEHHVYTLVSRPILLKLEIKSWGTDLQEHLPSPSFSLSGLAIWWRRGD